MLNLKCLGWQGHPLTVYGTSANANLRNSLAGGLGLQYADRDLGADEKAFYGEKMSAVVLFQDACLSDPAAYRRAQLHPRHRRKPRLCPARHHRPTAGGVGH